MSKVVTYVEIDIDHCALTYGNSPCTASIPETGAIKCFNSPVTCQVRPNFDNQPVTLRFAMPTGYLPDDIEAIPSIKSVQFTPAVVSLGENLGQRATLSVTFSDHRWSDAGPGFDKYYSERPYDPFKQGTFWGKFRARNPFLRGRPIRIIEGTVGQTLDQMDTRHYLIDSFDGPKRDGSYTIKAKDVLKFADGDRAQAPRLSNGFLVDDITAAAGVANLAPTGIGDAEYPAEGYVNIGGKEICAFTRVGDVLTLTERGALGTPAEAHEGNDRAQLCLRYLAQDPAAIIADLFQNYADVPASFIPLASWLSETENFLQRVLTTTIAEPTPVKQLVSEIIEQTALALWQDDRNRIIRLQVLRGIVTDADRFTRDNTLDGSFVPTEQPGKRVNQIWTYFGQLNPLKPLDEKENYRSTALTVNLEAEVDYGSPAIKVILSRWIPQFGRAIALRTNDIILSRFTDPPRRFSFAIHRVPGETASIELGGGYLLEAGAIQDATGAAVEAPIQVTQLKPESDKFVVQAEEMLFRSTGELVQGLVILDTNANNINLRAVHDTLYRPAEDGDTVSCIIEAAAIIGSANTALPAFDAGDWPAGVTVNVIVIGRIQGAGGKGGKGADANNNNATGGGAGGIALYTRTAINLTSEDGEIWGGAGGGGGGGTDGSGSGGTNGGSGGGGGAGQLPGIGNSGGFGAQTSGLPGAAATTEIGGIGGQRSPIAGNGGAPGEAGTSGANGNRFPGRGGAAAGAAIDGDSFVTDVGAPGDIRSSRTN